MPEAAKTPPPCSILHASASHERSRASALYFPGPHWRRVVLAPDSAALSTFRLTSGTSVVHAVVSAAPPTSLSPQEQQRARELSGRRGRGDGDSDSDGSFTSSSSDGGSYGHGSDDAEGEDDDDDEMEGKGSHTARVAARPSRLGTQEEGRESDAEAGSGVAF